MCRPRQCSSATNWWKLPSVTFSVSSKDSTGFCGGKGVVIPGTPRAPPTAPGPAPYTRPTPWAPPTDAGPPLPKTPPIHLGPALSVRPTPRGPTHSLGLPLRRPRPRSLTRPFLRLRPPLQAPPPPPPGSWGAGVAPGPPTCAEGNWGTASRSRPCSWEWMLARARWDRVSLCEKTEGGRRAQRLTPPPAPSPPTPGLLNPGLSRALLPRLPRPQP